MTEARMVTAIGIVLGPPDRQTLIPRTTHDDDGRDTEASTERASRGIVLEKMSTVVEPGSLVGVMGALKGNRLTVDSVRHSKAADIFNCSPALEPSGAAVYTRPEASADQQAWEHYLLRSGQLTSRRYLRARDGSWRVIASAPNPEAVRLQLEHAYGSQLTLVRSAWTSAQFDAARKEATKHLDDWELSALVDGTNDRGLPVLRIAPRELTPTIEIWSESLPAEATEVFPFIADATNDTSFSDRNTTFSHRWQR
ncbi:hypothetical protein [Microbacterium arborescens]|uniref:hypothetical protein n=1 Tax=Microbacterium arborescens TaxID=33883 RepID=UPI00278A277E|nr:hypothetical protein [Microbacterium arborescens]MDQ1218032.1 hypothetical protein [Microbacterium arborescens]